MSHVYKSNMDDIPPKSFTDKCIVLDLDETLVHSFSDVNKLIELGILNNPDCIDLRDRIYTISMDDVVYKRGQGIKTDMWGILRPHVKDFLVSCFTYFKIVIVWSAGKKKYVEAIVDALFKDIRRPHIIYTYDNCERTSNGLIVKPLTKLLKDIPHLTKYVTLNNMFILDDRETVYSGFEGDTPHNGIQIPAYKPADNIESLRGDDIRLKQLTNWLFQDKVKQSSDVRTLDKTNIFHQSVTK